LLYITEEKTMLSNGTACEYQGRETVVVAPGMHKGTVFVRSKYNVWDGTTGGYTSWRLIGAKISDLFPYTNPPERLARLIPDILAIPLEVVDGKVY
jgi:hypothetical protein